MSKDRIRELLAQLQDEIRNTDMDDELKTLVSDLDSDIHDLVAALVAQCSLHVRCPLRLGLDTNRTSRYT